MVRISLASRFTPDLRAIRFSVAMRRATGPADWRDHGPDADASRIWTFSRAQRRTVERRDSLEETASFDNDRNSTLLWNLEPFDGRRTFGLSGAARATSQQLGRPGST